jgi:hypothetical protein
MRNPIAGVVSAALLSAMAFASGSQTAPTTLPTHVVGVSTLFAPPADFDPVTASDDELASYALPPRPDATAEPQAYASWKKAMLASKERVFGELQVTNHYNGTPKLRKIQDGAVSSGNWSGFADVNKLHSYNTTTSYYYILADYVMPMAEQPFGVCDGGWDYSSSWVGIDGFNSSDVLQAGTESDAYCNGGTQSTFYSAWIEWFPFSETRISLPVTGGDDMFVEVWNTSPVQGYAYLVNENTGQVQEYGLNPPSGTQLVGNSAEWVVERPGVGGGLANLTNYIQDYFANCFAYNFTQKPSFGPGSKSNAILTNYKITMDDNAGHPISYPTLLGPHGIWFQDEGSAH